MVLIKKGVYRPLDAHAGAIALTDWPSRTYFGTFAILREPTPNNELMHMSKHLMITPNNELIQMSKPLD